jgi:hypothetical protein
VWTFITKRKINSPRVGAERVIQCEYELYIAKLFFLVRIGVYLYPSFQLYLFTHVHICTRQQLICNQYLGARKPSCPLDEIQLYIYANHCTSQELVEKFPEVVEEFNCQIYIYRWIPSKTQKTCAHTFT